MTEMLGSEDPPIRREGAAVTESSAAAQLGGVAESSREGRPVAAKPPVVFVVLVSLLVVKAWLMRGFALGTWNPIGATVFETAVLVLVMGLADLLPPRRWHWLNLAVYSVISVFLFAMTVYVRFYSQLFDPHMMAMAGQLGTVTDVVAELIKPVYALFLIDIPVLAVWIVMLRRKAGQQQADAAANPLASPPRRLAQPTSRSLKVALLTLVAAVVVVGQLFSAMQVPEYVDGVAIAKARGLAVAQAVVFLPRADGDADEEVSADVVAPGTQVSAPPTATAKPQTPGGKMQAKIERIRGALNGSRIATFAPGAYADKDIIVVQVEALNTMVMEKKFEGHEITPNLNRVLDESWYFPNAYSQTGIGNTADAEFIMNASLYAPRSQAAPVAYPDREIPALPRLLGAQGYDTFTMHPNRVAYWNRKELYSALGFAGYYDSPFFHWVDVMGFGSSDEVLLRKAVSVLEAKEASQTPYYAQLITLSAHTPFQYIPQSRRPFRTSEKYRGTLVGDYITAQAYGDVAIGQFVSALKKDGIWDDSIVIFYGDHTGMLENKLDGANAEIARSLLGREYGHADRQRMPLIIHLPGQVTPQVNSSVVGMVDIMPTIADLVGLDLTEVPHMGRSVFVDSNAMVPLNSYLPGGSFLNDNVLFMPGLGFEDGSAVKMGNSASIQPTKTEEDDYHRMRELTKISHKWVLSLPKRKDAGKLEDAWIPNNEARRAGAPLGVKQRGSGSGD
jgi:phosphoglycerol transferase MdoB-like AlkP superfamily enzyme